jgi:ABC-type lipoprotein release transport system permease subunit
MGTWVQRQKNIIEFTLSSLLRRKGKNAALVFVFTLVVFFLASVIFFTQAIEREASVVLAEAPDMIVQRMIAGRQDPIPLSHIDRIRKVRGIQSINGRLWGYYYDPVVGANYTLMVSDNAEEGSITVGEGVARARLLDVGDEVEFKASDGVIIHLPVRDIFSAESELVSSDLIVVSEGDFRRLFGLPASHVTDLILQVGNPREQVTIAEKIASLLPDTRIILRDEILRTYDTIFDWRGGVMLVILFGGLLAFVILAWDKASGLSVEERRETGILKALGWETSDVILLKFWEGLAISLSSFFTGLIVAYIHVFFTSSALFEPVLKGWSVLYPKFKLTPFIDPYQVVTLFFMTVVPYTVATIVPSWRASTIDPDSVMREI